MDYIHNYYWYDDDCHNKRNGFICEIPDNGHLGNQQRHEKTCLLGFRHKPGGAATDDCQMLETSDLGSI